MQALYQWLEELGSYNSVTRFHAMDKLAELGRLAIPPLLDLITYDEGRREAACLALMRLQDGESLQTTVRFLLQHPQKRVRVVTADHLFKLGDRPEADAIFRDALTDADETIKSHILRNMTADQVRNHLDHVLALADSPVSTVRQAVVIVLSVPLYGLSEPQCEAIAKTLLKLLKSKKTSLHLGAAEALAWHSHPVIAQDLIDLYDDVSPLRRESLVVALGKTNTQIAADHLVAALQDDPSERVYGAILTALVTMHDERALAALVDGIQHQAMDVRFRVLQLIEKVDARPVLDQFVAAYERNRHTETPTNRLKHMVVAIAHAGGDDAVPHLITLLEDDDIEIVK